MEKGPGVGESPPVWCSPADRGSTHLVDMHLPEGGGRGAVGKPVRSLCRRKPSRKTESRLRILPHEVAGPSWPDERGNLALAIT